MLPNSPEAERAILGMALRDNSHLADIIDEVKDEYFFADAHRLIFNSVKAVYNEGISVDLISVADRLRSSGHDDAVGLQTLVELLEDGSVSTNPTHYITILKRDYFVRSTMRASAAVIEDAKKHWDSAESFLAHAERTILTAARTLGHSRIYGMTETLDAVLNQVENLLQNNGAMTGVPSGFTDLDRVTGGFQPGHLILLAARPGMGKTALALNMMVNALMAGKSVLMFSLEMTRIEIMLRCLSSLARVDGQNLKLGNLSENELDRMMAATRQLAPLDGRFGLDDSQRLNLADLRSRCRRFRDRGGLDFVIVDYVGLMQPMPGTRFDSHAQVIASISQGLKELAKELQIPILALAQLNRDLEKRASQRPKASDLKDSGSLEADADMVLLIYRDDVVNPDSQDAGLAEVIIGKNRHGPMPTIRLAYIANFVKFTNLAP
jgi:replicative DNA helicase